MKNVSLKNIQKDIVSGIIVALVSIPISMGYAQIAGLPAVYGLYCSILPVLIYGLVTSSPQFVFGVDATPAALVGGTLATLGIVTGSEEAKTVVPAITLVAALWLLICKEKSAVKSVYNRTFYLLYITVSVKTVEPLLSRYNSEKCSWRFNRFDNNSNGPMNVSSLCG